MINETENRVPYRSASGKYWCIMIDGKEHMFPSLVKAQRAFRMLINSKLKQLEFNFEQKNMAVTAEQDKLEKKLENKQNK